MALHVSPTITETYELTASDAAGKDSFDIPVGFKRINVFRDAGIIYETADPDGYTVTKTGDYITKITLNTALSANEQFKLMAFAR